MRGIERDFEAFALGEALAGHRVIKLDLIASRGAAEGPADEAGERLADGRFGFVRWQPHGEGILELPMRPDGADDRLRHSRGFRDLRSRSQLGGIAVEQGVAGRQPALDQRPGDLHRFYNNRRSHCGDGRVGIVDVVPAFGDLVLLVGQIDAVARVNSHLRHAIRRDDDRFAALKGTGQFDGA